MDNIALAAARSRLSYTTTNGTANSLVVDGVSVTEEELRAARLLAYQMAGKYPEGGARALHLHPAGADVEIVDARAGTVRWPSDRTKFAIVGFSQSTYLQAPFDDASWVIGGLNQLGRYLPRADLWFELHQRSVFTEDQVRGTDYVQWLQHSPLPIFMEADDFDRGAFRDIPSAVRFPIEACTDLLGPIYRPGGREERLDYYDSTIALEIAWAALMGFTEIGIWGVDLIIGDEYDYQKANAEFWLGFCQGRGIKLTIPSESALLKGVGRRYGHAAPDMGPFSLKFFNAILANAFEKREQMVTDLNNVDGAMAAIRNLRDALMIYQRGGTLKDVELIKKSP